jgi:hypothetical protein
MTMTKAIRVTILAFAACNASFATATPATIAVAARGGRPFPGYDAVVRKVAAMPEDARAQGMASRAGLEILNLLWEDTGRWQGSSLGPNISDVTIEVEMSDGRGHKQTALMPVLRHPNFTDKTGDVALDKLMIPVGNQRPVSAPLAYVSLRDFLTTPGRFLTLPDKGRIKGGTLLARRDSHALVSAQATFLPVPSEGKATFWPVIFNYQSSRKNPAVLTLVVTRQGTSATIIDNARDSIGVSSWGQRLFFNDGGQRAPLTGERLSDVKSSGATMNGESADSLGADANLLMIIQIPLKFRAPPARAAAKMMDFERLGGVASNAPAAAPAGKRAAHAASDVEVAVLGHGPELGPYTELDGQTIERDPRFPVRVTVQFYQATSNGVLAAADVQALRRQIKNVYAMADYVGSLVVPRAADRARPTNWDGVGPRPPGVTIQDFPGLMQRRRDGLTLHPPAWDRGID